MTIMRDSYAWNVSMNLKRQTYDTFNKLTHVENEITISVQ